MNEKRIRPFGLLFLTFTCVAEVLVAYSYVRGVYTVEHYASTLIFVFVGMTMISGGYRKQVDLWVGAAMCAWYVISRILLGEMYLEYSYGMLSNLACAYLMCFPFAHSAQDGEKKSGLKAAAVVLGIGYGVLACVAVLAAMMGRFVALPILGTQVGIKHMRLEAGAHPNISAVLFLIALVMIVWLSVQERRCWITVMAVIMGVCLYTGIALTVSRTVMLQAGCFAAGILFLAMLRLPVRALWKRIIIGLAAGVAGLVLVFISFDWVINGVSFLSEQFVAHAEMARTEIVMERSFFDDLATMTGRTGIYKNIWRMMQENPSIWFKGVLNSEMVPLLKRYTGCEHAHNSYLQTLVNMGLPGLLMAVFFAVRAIWVSFKLIFNCKASFVDQLLAIMLLMFLLGTIPESYWFSEYLTAANMPFFLIFGYVLEVERQLRA